MQNELTLYVGREVYLECKSETFYGVLTDCDMDGIDCFCLDNPQDGYIFTAKLVSKVTVDKIGITITL